jgi:osmoprotectant transport system permease protein
MGLWEFLQSNRADVLAHTAEHLWLVAVSTLVAVLVGLPTGVLLTRFKILRGPVLGLANVMQTVPSLALFGLLIPLPFIGGIGARTAIVALVLYALLPVIRNTVTGILSVDPPVREAAVAMGLTDWQILRQVELPLAAGVILTGVRVALVITIGVAVIAAAVGAGGLGEYIFRGLRQNDDNLLLTGAGISALMALAADFLLGLLEKQLDARTGRVKETRRQATFRRVIWGAVAIVLVVSLSAFAFGKFNAWRAQKSSAGEGQAGGRVRVGSKDFTESVLLAEMLAQMLEARGVEVERQFELAGNLTHTSLVAGRIDCYPEYTGTAYTAILQHPPITDPRAVYEQVRQEYLEKFSLATSDPLGFSNDFAILVRGAEARRLQLKTISDAVPHARTWRAGFGQDFMSRADGYPGFARAYGFRFNQQPREMDLSLTYRALAAGQVDIIAGNSTDGLISALDLFQLEDDRHYFPPYEAVIFARSDALARNPVLSEVLSRMGRAISTEEMRRLNYQVDGEKRDRREAVSNWLKSKGL